MKRDYESPDYRYNTWAGNPAGHAQDPARCVYEVYARHTRWPTFMQCRRGRGHGPSGLYCSQHAARVAP